MTRADGGATSVGAAPSARQGVLEDPFPRVPHRRWGNARIRVEESAEGTWLVKDFSGCGPVVRATLARVLLRRERRACAALAGLDGVPQGCSRPAPLAFRYRFMPGRTLRDTRKLGLPLDAGFFESLERLVAAMHARGIVHLDLRNGRNVLVREDGRPGLLDFQTALRSRGLPGALRRALEHVDRSAVYKHWRRMAPDSLGPERAAWLRRFDRWRLWWPFEGYAIQKWWHRVRRGRRGRG